MGETGERVVLITGDTHLRGGREEPAWRGFRQLCDFAEHHASAVYHIGDLFDYWVGPRQAKLPGFADVVDRIARLAERVPVHVLVGNRDFAMGPEIGDIPGVTLHRGDTTVEWPGGKALLTHGDLLLENDRAYQRMRCVIRNPVLRSSLRAMPLAVSLRLAGALREKSQDAVAAKPRAAFQISWPLVRSLFRQGDHDLIVAGHIHRPTRYEGPMAGRVRRFLTLGAWGARGWVVRLGPGKEARLERFPGGDGTPSAEPLP